MKPNMQVVEVVVWTVLAFLSASAMRVFRPMPLSNDSFQYLNVAEHARHDHQLATSLVYYDTERSHGRIPAPLTTFPVGYPFLVAMLSFWNNFEVTARALSAVCYAGTATLLACALIAAGVTAFLRQLALLLFVTNAVALSYATAVLTEPLYLLLSTGAVVGLLWAESGKLPKRVVIVRVVIASLAAGLACWVRYAGFFLVAAVVSYAVFRLLLPGSRFRTVFLLGALIPITIAGSLMARNVITVGTWKGGNDMLVQNSVKGVLAKYVNSQLHLILGRHTVTFGVWEGLLLAGGCLIAVFLIAAARQAGVPNSGARWMDYWRKTNIGALLVGLCVVVYSAGIFYAGLRTVITFGSRMFLPVLPLYLLLLAMGGNWLMFRLPAGPRNAWLAAGFLLTAVGYVGLNARDLFEPPSPARYQALLAEYNHPAADGRPLLEWIDAHISAGATIIAADGQMTGYLLHRPTISMVSANFSPARWECEDVRKQMKRFHASYVFLYKPPSANGEALLPESRFVAASVVSRQPPCGFVIAAENSGVRILKSTALD